jgi:hypothetical protein
VKDTLKVPVVHFNPGEAKLFKAKVYDLSELGAKQALYGIIQILSFKVNVSRPMFEEVVDDAVKYSQNRIGGDRV